MIFGKKRVQVHVLFHGSILGGPLTFCCAPGWKHCLLLITIYFPEPNVFASRYTMRVEPTAWGLDLDVVWRSPEAVIADYLEHGCTAVLRMDRTLQPQKTLSLRGLISCVSVLKAALGLDGWWVITPYQLFSALVREGAHIVHLEDTGHDSSFQQAANGTGRRDTAASG